MKTQNLLVRSYLYVHRVCHIHETLGATRGPFGRSTVFPVTYREFEPPI